MRWRVYYDQYRYRARYDYALAGGIQDARDLTAGDWVGSRLSYDFTVPRVGTLTVGSELNVDLRTLQRYYAVSPQPVEYLHVNNPDILYGLFAQQQWQLSPAWNAYFGVRFDDSKSNARFISPRLALIYQPTDRSTYKFLYGRAFREPNAYEMFYEDGVSLVGNAGLRPEHAQTLEVAAERKLTKDLSGLLTVYHYWLGGLIQAVTLDGGLLQYQNVARNGATGVEVELSGRPAAWIETTASLALQRATNTESNTPMTNSPARVAKLRAAVPFLKSRLETAAAVQYLSSRTTVSGSAVPPVWLADLTFTTNRINAYFDLQFGIRSLLDRAYYDPAGVGLIQDRIRQDGRAVFLKLIWRTRE
ncbi:MAG: TonB-dependent receptor [Acidobacteria bacterium]|nr:TonB-dependent receptor [Acidobacteriota bacterium]